MLLVFFIELIFNCSIIVDYHWSAMSYLCARLYLCINGKIIVLLSYYLEWSVCRYVKWAIVGVSNSFICLTKSNYYGSHLLSFLNFAFQISDVQWFLHHINRLVLNWDVFLLLYLLNYNLWVWIRWGLVIFIFFRLLLIIFLLHDALMYFMNIFASSQIKLSKLINYVFHLWS